MLIGRLKGLAFKSVYFGGGTPLTMPWALKSIIDRVRPYLIPGADIAVEIHPRDVTAKTMDWLRQIGFTMVSLGIESFSQSTLDILGRGYDSKLACQALDLVLNAGFKTVNVDLITCIPGQSMKEILADFQGLLDLNVDQISAYPLMDFPFTSLKSSYSPLKQRRVLSSIAVLGQAQGYRRSSVWTWTKPTATKYTSITRETCLGLGAGAATYYDGYFGLNTFDVASYIGALSVDRAPTALYSNLTPEESALYWLFWRCYEGEIDLTAPQIGRIKNLLPLINTARTFGLVEVEPGSVFKGPILGDTLYAPRKGTSSAYGEPGIVRLTEKGFALFHLVERHYTRSYIGRLWQECHNSPFPPAMVL